MSTRDAPRDSINPVGKSQDFKAKEMLEEVWFITGCSSGIGLALANEVLTRGIRAVVTARKPAALAALAAEHRERALVIGLDITDPKQIVSAVTAAEDAFGRIDVLVNNAGFGYLAAIEEGNDEEIFALFRTNVFATASVIRSVLPGMRQRRQGCVVNISSAGGLVGLAGMGYYSASKFALEGLSQALALEVNPLGIRVAIIVPGPVRTEFTGKSLLESSIRIDAYEPTAGMGRQMTRGLHGRQPGDPVRVARVIVEAVHTGKPYSHIVLGQLAQQLVRENLRILTDDIEESLGQGLVADFPASDGASL